MVILGITDIYILIEMTLSGEVIVDKTAETAKQFKFLAKSHLSLYSFIIFLNLGSSSIGMLL